MPNQTIPNYITGATAGVIGLAFLGGCCLVLLVLNNLVNVVALCVSCFFMFILCDSCYDQDNHSVHSQTEKILEIHNKIKDVLDNNNLDNKSNEIGKIIYGSPPDNQGLDLMFTEAGFKNCFEENFINMMDFSVNFSGIEEFCKKNKLTDIDKSKKIFEFLAKRYIFIVNLEGSFDIKDFLDQYNRPSSDVEFVFSVPICCSAFVCD